MKLSFFLTPLVAAVAMAVAPASAAVYTQAFDKPGALPADWVAAGYFDSDSGTVGVETVSGGGSVTGLRQSRTKATGGAAGNSWVYYTGSFDEVTGGVLSNFTASAIVRIQATGKGASNGFMVRAAAPSGTNGKLSGYFITFARGDSANNIPGTLEIYSDPGSASAKGTLLQSAPLDIALSYNTDYRFEITANNNLLIGNLYIWDDNTDSFSKSIGTISLESTLYGGGLFGFRTTHDGSSQSILWRDLKIETIPEPAAATILLPVGLAFLLMRKRQR